MDNVLIYVDSDFKELIPIFLRNRQEEISALRLALTEGDYLQITKIGERLTAGTGSGYGFYFLQDIGPELEQAAKSEDDINLAIIIDLLDETMANVEIIYEE